MQLILVTDTHEYWIIFLIYSWPPNQKPISDKLCWQSEKNAASKGKLSQSIRSGKQQYDAKPVKYNFCDTGTLGWAHDMHSMNAGFKPAKWCHLLFFVVYVCLFFIIYIYYFSKFCKIFTLFMNIILYLHTYCILVQIFCMSISKFRCCRSEIFGFFFVKRLCSVLCMYELRV